MLFFGVGGDWLINMIPVFWEKVGGTSCLRTAVISYSFLAVQTGDTVRR